MIKNNKFIFVMFILGLMTTGYMARTIQQDEEDESNEVARRDDMYELLNMLLNKRGYTEFELRRKHGRRPPSPVQQECIPIGSACQFGGTACCDGGHCFSVICVAGHWTR